RNFEIDFKKKGGEEFLAEVSSSLLNLGGKKAIQVIVRDITERKKMDKRLKTIYALCFYSSHEKWRTDSC
ncbi:MAG TPA: PAS domain S-box protein, partial [Archaeoglobaceae archaeon]|nr:PAS domain S-box protein [Archaeoglobaceae archaeon]